MGNLQNNKTTTFSANPVVFSLKKTFTFLWHIVYEQYSLFLDHLFANIATLDSISQLCFAV